MTQFRAEQEGKLRKRLSRLRDSHEDHWAYSGPQSFNRSALFQYPAMMVADMQRDLTEALLADRPRSRGPVFDPFVGSGTVLSAAMELGRDFVGWDINPLAILICKVKAGPLHVAAFEHATEEVLNRRRASHAEERFDNWRHWFTADVAIGLTSLREGVAAQANLPTRRFLWLCLAETVRLTSNSRTSTVKLHRRSDGQIETRPDPREVFKRVARDNLIRLRSASLELTARKVIKRGWYQGEVVLALGDTRKLEWKGDAATTLVTSPPYGDNTSTVPYGQHAYLPLQWIDLIDIHAQADPECLASTYEIDRRSLGGSKRITADNTRELGAKSAALKTVLDHLAVQKKDRLNRVVAFMRDFDEAIGRALSGVERGGTTAWTVGSRRVGGQRIPLEQVVVDLAKTHGYSHVNTLRREIPAHRKRMAKSNGTGATMSREHVVVLRRNA